MPVDQAKILKLCYLNNQQLHTLYIPLTQRDYAQGRDMPKVEDIRRRFVGALKKALINNDPITLDFVYGEIDNNRTLIPLDGQQRLTTLFLLRQTFRRNHRSKLDAA